MKEKLQSITIADNEEYLRQASEEVDIMNDSSLNKDIEVLEEYCLENEVMAMAAVQLGIPKRLVYIKNTNLDVIGKMQTSPTTEEELHYNEARVLINPVIVNREGLTEYWEACASCLDSCGRVLRPYRIEVEYYDINGNKHKDNFVGFESTVLSHEMDHLDGILHIDIAEEVKHFTREERKKWRQSHGYKVYSKIGDFVSLVSREKGKNKILKKEIAD